MAVRTREVLDGTDRTALATWAGTRLGVLVVSVALAAFWSFGDLKDSFLNRWTQWDVDLFIEIAKYGYGGDPAQPPDAGLPAFFPGLPILIRVVHFAVPSWDLSALLISPFARRGYVDHRVSDTTSVLAFIAARFGLKPLQVRDAKAYNLLDGLDFGRAPRPANFT